MTPLRTILQGTQVYVCVVCGSEVVSPFDDTPKPDYCPPCFRALPPEKKGLYEGEG